MTWPSLRERAMCEAVILDPVAAYDQIAASYDQIAASYDQIAARRDQVARRSPAAV